MSLIQGSAAFEDFPCGRNKKAKTQPTVVCLCGSTKFKELFEEAAQEETLSGKIVLSVGLFGHLEKAFEMAGETKRMLDKLHLHKIDLADEILVLNKSGYVGMSACDEIAYAIATGKRVRFYEPLAFFDPAKWSI